MCMFLTEILAQPHISVSPASLNATLVSCNDSVIKTLAVHNTGTSNLTYSGTVNFVNVPTGYCIPTYSSMCSSNDYINNFTFNTLSKLNSGCNGAVNNYIFDQSVTTNVFPGLSYTMTMQAGSSYSQGFGVWIDYNRNGSFNDPGEFVYASPNASTSMFITNITIPANAPSGKTMMRVRCRYSNTVTATGYCSNFSYGETEDYAITIGSPYFTVSPSAGTILPGDSAILNVKFKSSGLNAGIYTSNLIIASNDTINPSIIVPCTLNFSGIPTIILSTANINFGILMVNLFHIDTILIHNAGCAPLIISAVNLPAGPFSVVNINSFPDTIIPSATVPLIIKYAPLAPGTYTKTLTIVNNDAGKTITLNGTATPPAQAYIYPNPVECTITHCNDSATIPLRIKNIGSVNLNYQVATRDSFFDNFENGLTRWTYTSPWGLQQSSYNGTYALTESPTGSYTNGMNTSIEMTIPYKITKKQLASLSYMLYYSTEGGYDYISTDISVNGGGWQQLSSFSGGSGWTLHSYSLSSYVNNGDLVKVRFRFSSDGSVTSDGVLIDDVKIISDGIEPWLIYPGLNGSLSSGDSITIPVKFKGYNLNNGTYTSNVRVITNDPLQDTTDVPCIFHVNGQPDMTYSKTCLQFDSILQYETTTDTVMFFNLACGTLVISNITHVNSAFHLDTTYFSINKGDTGLLIVTFNPLMPGQYYDTLNVMNNDSNIRICLHGFAKFPPQISVNPDTLNITINSCNDSLLIPVTISNTGNSNLNYQIGNAIHAASCAPVTTGYCCDMGIYNVSFNTINNSTNPGFDGYQDYSSSQQTTVFSGNSYTLSVTSGTGYYENTRAWIDYNNNGSFETNELVLEVFYHIGLCSQQVTIPSTTIRNIPLRMRVMSEYYYNATPEPCQNVQYGQTEDYAVIIHDGVTVPFTSGIVTPGNSTVVNIKFSSHGLYNNTYIGNFNIISNDPLNPVVTIPYTFVVNGTPDIHASASSINFDTIFQYSTKQDSVSFTNQGCTNLVISNIIHSNAAFQIDSTSFNLLPGVTKRIHVTFHPLIAGLHADTLNVYNNDSLIKICLKGYAAQPPVMNHIPDSIYVSLNNCNDSITVPIILHNTGDANLTWNINSFVKNSLSFNGSNTYVNVPNYTGFPTGNTSVTIEAWVYPTGYPDPTYNGIVSYGYRGCTAYAFVLSMTNAGRPSFASWCNDFVPATGPTASLNTWHHVAAVLTGNQVTLYLDNYSWTTTLTYTPNIQGGNLMIGSTDNPGRIFNGKIDEVRMWNYARSNTQITQNIYQSVNPASNGLVAYWNFDEGAGAILNDITGNGHTGTVTGAVWSTQSPAAGQYSADNTSGNIIPNEYDTINVTFYSRNLISGIYIKDIILNSNDPLNTSDTIYTTLVFTGHPIIQVTKNCFEFDTITQYTQKNDSLWIINSGCDSLKITDITSTTGAFTVSSNVFSIAPNDSAKLITTFYPLTPGNFIDTLQIFNNASLKKICLHGFALSPPIITTTPNSMTFTINTCNGSASQNLTIGNAGAQNLNWNIVPGNITNIQTFESGIDMNFWSYVNLGSTSAGCGFYAGGLALYFDGNGTREAQTKDFNVLNGGTLKFYMRIGSGNFPCEQADGGEDIILQYSTNVGLTWTAITVLYAGTHATFTLDQLSIPPAAMTTATRFRWVQPNNSGSGCDNWAIDNLSIESMDGLYSFSQSTNSIVPGDTNIVLVTVSTAGLLSGTYHNNVLVYSNDPLITVDTIPCTVIVNGYPVISTLVNCLIFDTIMQFTSVQDTLYIYNNGCDSLHITNITHVSASYQADITTLNLAPGDSERVIVTFSPVTFGSIHDTLKIFNNDSLVKICLNGYAYKPPVFTHTPDSLVAIINNCNDSVVVPLTIHNTGDTILTYNLVTQNAGNILQFNGSSSYVDLGPWFNYQTFTIELWVKAGATQQQYADIIDNNHTGYRSFVLQQNSTNTNQYGWGTNDGGSGALFTLNADQWTHIALVRDGSAKLNKVYINGTLFSSFVGTTNIPYDGTQFLRLCRWGGGGRNWNGAISEVRIWDYARTQQQLSQNMNLLISHNESGLSAYYDFHEGTALSLGDVTSNAHNGLISGATWSTDILPRQQIITSTTNTGFVSAGNSTIVNVTFHSNSLITGTYERQIIINTNDPLTPADTIPCILHFNGNPAVTFSDTCVVFDTTIQYTMSGRSFKIYNTGCDTLFISNITSSLSEFTVNPLNVVILPGDSASFSADFHPITAGAFNGDLTVHSNTANVNLCIKGVSVLPPVIAFSPDSINISMTACNDTLVFPLIIKNTGSYMLSYTVGNSQFNPPSCTPATTQYCCGVGITRVQFNTIDYVTVDGTDGYQDYSFIQTQIMAGQAYPVTIKTGTQFNENVCLWIDMNNNGSFESNEKLFESLNQLLTHTGNITIPSTAVMQTPLRMRIGSDLSTNPAPQPCVNSQFGQFEDYKIIIGGGISFTNGTGNIVAGDSTVVNVHMNAQQTTAGSYTYNIPINSNDPLNPLVYVPCVINISPRPSQVVANDTSICFGNPTPDLISTGVIVEWFNNSELTSLANTGNTFITGLTTSGIYTWYVTQTINNCKSPADTVVLAIYDIPAAPSAVDVAICYGNSNSDLYAAGTNIQWYSDSLLTNLVYTGNIYNTGNSNVGSWTYYLTQTTNGCTGPKDTATLTINPVLSPPLVHDTLICYQSPNPVLLAIGLQIKWYSDSTMLSLVHTGNNYTPAITAAGIHKFYVTQTDTINGCESNPSVNTFSIFLPSTPVSSDTAICYGQTVPDLNATGTNVQWFSDAGLTTLVYSGNIFVTGIDTVGFYPFFVTQTDNLHNCQSLANTTVLTIWGIPAAPVTADETICFGQITQPITSTGSNIIWYSGMSIVHTGNTYTPSQTTVGAYSYLVTQTVNNCSSPADTVIFTINPLPFAPLVHDTVVCSGNPVPDLIAQGLNIRWYSDNTLLNLVHSGDTLVSGVTNMGTHHWYATQTIAATGCEGLYSMVTLTIDSLPLPPVVNDKAVCFSFPNPAFTTTGINVIWYSDVALTNTVQIGNTFTSSETAVGTYVYFVTQNNNCGEGSADSAALTIKPIPSPPVVTGNAVCFGQPILPINATGTNITWYQDSAQTIVLYTANTYTPNVTVAGTYTFYLTQTVNACESTTDTAILIIHALPLPPVANDQYTCTALVPPLTATGEDIQWYDSLGNVFVGDTLNTGLTQFGVYMYYATQTSSITGCESYHDTVVLTISTTLTNPPVVNDTASCFGQTVPDLTAQGVNINWYGDPALTILVGTGTSFQSTSTGPGTYTYYLNQQNICGSSPSTSATLTIYSLPSTPVSPDTSTCKGNPIGLSATGNNIHWYQDINLTTLLFNGNNFIPSIYNLPGTYTYYLTDSSSVTGCISLKDSVIFIIKDIPIAPVAGNATACFGGLIPDLTASGTNVNWYSDSQLMNLVFTGDTFATGQINLGTYTYYLAQGNECGTSVIDTATLIIGNQPTVPVVTNDASCFGLPNQPLSVTGTNINWYTDTALTQHIFTGNNYTPTQTAVGTYTWYVTQTTTLTGCISDYVPITLLIHDLPVAPAVHDSSVCAGSQNPVLSATGNNVAWYSDAGLTVNVHNGNDFIPTVTSSGIYNYYITQTQNNCASPSSHLVFTINSIPSAPIAMDDTVCEGGVIPVFTSVGTNLTWYSDPALTLIVATGFSYQPVVTNPGVYNWYVTQTQNGCEGSYDVATLNIKLVPPSPDATDDTICYGGIIPVLTALGTNVVWYSDIALTDTLQNGNNYQPADTSVGVYHFYVTQTAGNCESTANDVTFVVFDASIPPVVSDNSICQGSGASILTATGVNIHWYNDAALNNLIYVGNILTTNDILPGTYTYYATQTVSLCGTSNSDIATLTVKSIPAAPAADNVTVCFGNPTPDLVANGSNLKWYSEPELIILVNDGASFSAGNSSVGTYIYFVTQNVNGCVSLANDVVLTINPTPFVTLNKYHVNINEGGNVTLIAYNASSYFWAPAAGLNISTGPVVVASPASTTTYVVTGTSSQGCSDTARCVVEVGQIGVDENDFSQYFSVYPNPTSGDLNIKFVSLQKEPLKIRFLNQLGQVLIDMKCEQINGTFEEIISLENIADGVYYLQVMAEKGVITKKVVLRR